MKRRTAQIEPVIAFWPARDCSWQKLGDTDYPTYGLKCESFWIQLRAERTDAYWLMDAVDAMSHTGIYVWIGENGNFKIELNARDIYSAGLRQMRAHTLLLAKLERRCKDVAGVYRIDGFETAIRAVLQALKIKRAIVYYPGKMHDEIVDLEAFGIVQVIVDEFKRRQAKIGVQVEEAA